MAGGRYCLVRPAPVAMLQTGQRMKTGGQHDSTQIKATDSEIGFCGLAHALAFRLAKCWGGVGPNVGVEWDQRNGMWDRLNF